MADVGLLNTRVYGGYFGFGNGDINPDNDYILSAPRAERVNVWSNIGGKDRTVDTPLELALFSYYAASRIDIRPIEAKDILPANDPKLADLKLGAATYMDMQVARFTGKDAAPYAAALKFITDRGNVSEADIKGFMRDGIRSALTAEMSKDRRGFVPIETYNNWKQRGYGDFVGTATDVLTAFFEDPTQRNYEAVRGMVARQLNLVGNGDILASYASADALMNAINYVSLDLGNKLNREISPTTRPAFARVPNDQRLNVFSIPYAVGGGR
ncbi:MAG: hypothetical protein LBK68_02295 [Candidatus Margulisbacteria bacterium]|jgi:hypothetical protein|nr:hypothetical protein [Candidatus Margulisiibacteriota bacterium]